jgi:hypothetical protein
MFWRISWDAFDSSQLSPRRNCWDGNCFSTALPTLAIYRRALLKWMAASTSDQRSSYQPTQANALGFFSALIQCVFKLCQFLSNSRVFFRLRFVVYPLEGGFF